MRQLTLWLLLNINFGYCGVVFAEAIPFSTRVEFVKQQLTVAVEVADTDVLRRHGLMGRTQLNADKGMLFVYSQEQELGVWMKNTLLPLDVLFLDDEGRIVSVLQNLQPCHITHCPVYSSVGLARYMLEVNAGFTAAHRISSGQKVKITR